ncbi:MAG TPA: hypothetical protein VHE30_14990 [Polyangiaceae bacterium]|nr:hypothetical protein [Polyangiaceae bacterium]
MGHTLSRFVVAGVRGDMVARRNGARGAVVAVVVLGAAAGCGQVVQVLTSPPGEPDGGANAASTGGAGSNTDGGSAASGSGGSAGDVGADGAAAGTNALDPHHDERERLVKQYCAVMDQYPCLGFRSSGGDFPPSASAEDKKRACEIDLGVGAFRVTPEACWDEWVAAVECDLTLPRNCPCGDESTWINQDSSCQYPNDVYGPLTKDGMIPAGPCAVAQSNYTNCVAGQTAETPFQWVSGSRGDAEWSESSSGCRMDMAWKQGLSATCEGPPGGPYVCTCFTYPQVRHEPTFQAETCAEAGQKMADGACARLFDCCYRWATDAGQGTFPHDNCECTTDPPPPSLYGHPFPTCQALADAQGATIVDVCP